nr:metalloregulator ArsR/SmtB family transcription factor [Pedobacter panaciterrae]
MELRRDVFQAIADPTRREIIDLLSNQSLNLNTVAGHFSITRPAISKHIKILTECGLIIVKQDGRERVCKVNAQKLKEVDKWLNRYRKFWNNKLDALGNFLEREDEHNLSKDNLI